MSDFDKPTTTGTQYTQVLPELRANIKGVAVMDYTGFQGIPNGTVKFSAGELSKYNGSSFDVVPISVSGGGTGSTTASGARVKLGVISETESDSRYLTKDGNLTGLTDTGIARTKLNVLEAGTGSSQARTNSQNDARFLDSTDQATLTDIINGVADKWTDAEDVNSFVLGEISQLSRDTFSFKADFDGSNYSVNSFNGDQSFWGIGSSQVSRVSTGVIQIEVPNVSTYNVQVTAIDASPYIVTVSGVTSTKFNIYIHDENGVKSDQDVYVTINRFRLHSN